MATLHFAHVRCHRPSADDNEDALWRAIVTIFECARTRPMGCAPVRSEPGTAGRSLRRASASGPLRRSRGRRAIVDGSEFSEFKAKYGKTLVTAFARTTATRNDHNGVVQRIRVKGAYLHRAKADKRKIPLLFLQNIVSWSAATTRPAESPSMAPRWSPQWPARGCPSDRAIGRILRYG